MVETKAQVPTVHWRVPVAAAALPVHSRRVGSVRIKNHLTTGALLLSSPVVVSLTCYDADAQLRLRALAV